MSDEPLTDAELDGMEKAAAAQAVMRPHMTTGDKMLRLVREVRRLRAAAAADETCVEVLEREPGGGLRLRIWRVGGGCRRILVDLTDQAVRGFTGPPNGLTQHNGVLISDGPTYLMG